MIKVLTSLLFILCLTGCLEEKDKEEPVYTEKILNQFKTHDFSSFFGSDELKFNKDGLGGVLFKIQPLYLTGGTLGSTFKHVGIALFKSHEAALSAVKARRNNVAAIITKGDHKIKDFDNWWFSESQALLSIVKGNLVFEISILNKKYSETEDLLWDTAVSFLDSLK